MTQRGMPDAEALARAAGDIACQDESDARACAERRQSEERDPEIEWIYLLREWDGMWVARPWRPDHAEASPPRKRSRKEKVVEGAFGVVLYLLNPLNWFDG
jgi:hypothetical protein